MGSDRGIGAPPDRLGHNPSWSPDSNGSSWPPRGWIAAAPPHGTEREMWSSHADRRPAAARAACSRRPGFRQRERRSATGLVAPRKAHRLLGSHGFIRPARSWTIDPDAPQPKQTVVQVTSDTALDWNPAWSPDGKHLYFGSDRDGTMNLWRIAIDEETGKPGGAPEPVSLPAVFAGNFAVSQAGQIAYVTVARSYRVVAMPFDAVTGKTGQPRIVLEGSMEAMSFDPSPDGQSLAFTTGGAQEDLFVVDSEGKHLRQLTNDAARDRGVVWSRTGKTISSFQSRRD